MIKIVEKRLEKFEKLFTFPRSWSPLNVGQNLTVWMLITHFQYKFTSLFWPSHLHKMYTDQFLVSFTLRYLNTDAFFNLLFPARSPPGFQEILYQSFGLHEQRSFQFWCPIYYSLRGWYKGRKCKKLPSLLLRKIIFCPFEWFHFLDYIHWL